MLPPCGMILKTCTASEIFYRGNKEFLQSISCKPNLPIYFIFFVMEIITLNKSNTSSLGMGHLLDSRYRLSLYKHKGHICVCGFTWHRVLLIKYNYLIDSIIPGLCLCSLSKHEYWVIPLSPCHFGNLSNHNVKSLAAACMYTPCDFISFMVPCYLFN